MAIIFGVRLMVIRLITIFLMFFSSALASSTITGVVVNAQSGKPIQDANIRILVSDIGDASDLDGSFLITL